MPLKEKKGGNTEEEDRDVMDTHELQEVAAARDQPAAGRRAQDGGPEGEAS